MHSLNTIRRLNDEEHRRVTEAAIASAQANQHQPQLEQTLAQYYAGRQNLYRVHGFTASGNL